MEEKKPIDDARILEAIESCRPGSDDLSDPDLADLAAALEANPHLAERYRRTQAADEVVSAAFKDVDVPEGLAERLMDRLGEAGPAVVSLPVASPRRVSRRWAVAGGTLLAVAAGLLVAVWIGINNVPGYGESDVLSGAIAFFNSDSADNGHLLAEREPPKAYKISRFVRQPAGTKWRKISGFLGRNGVAYDLPSQGGAVATLYVVRRSVAGLPVEPPAASRLNTGGVSTAAWQQGDLLYVLVVQGGSRTYRSFLDLPRGPVV